MSVAELIPLLGGYIGKFGSLGKIAGQEDVIIGSPVSGRVHDQLEHTVGPVMNAILLRSRLKGHESFNTFLEGVKETAAADF